MSHADVKNHHRLYPVMNDDDAIKNFLDQNVEITEENMDLINEFLNV